MRYRLCTGLLCTMAAGALLSLPLSQAPVHAQTFSTPAGAANVANGGAFSTNSTWGDFDGDGDIDAYVTNWVSLPDPLYQNNSDGTFTDVAAVAGITDLGNSIAAAWGDYDNDGDLDLYIVDFRLQDQLFENTNGSFSEIGRTNQLINLNKQGSETSVAWGDYDNDGFLDLYVGKYYHDNELYHNVGGTTFEFVDDLGLGDRRDTNGFSWVDYDNDGDLDLYVVNRDQENGFYRNDLSDGGILHRARLCAVRGQHRNRPERHLGRLQTTTATWICSSPTSEPTTSTATTAPRVLSMSPSPPACVGRHPAGSRRWRHGQITTAMDSSICTRPTAVTSYSYRMCSLPAMAMAPSATPRLRQGYPTAGSAHLSTTWVDFDGDGAPDLYSTDGWGVGNILSQNETPDERFIKVTVRGKGAAEGGNKPLWHRLPGSTLRCGNRCPRRLQTGIVEFQPRASHLRSPGRAVQRPGSFSPR